MSQQEMQRVTTRDRIDLGDGDGKGFVGADGSIIRTVDEYYAYCKRMADRRAAEPKTPVASAPAAGHIIHDVGAGEPPPGPVVEVDLSTRPDICTGPLHGNVPTTPRGGQAELSEADLKHLREGK